MGAYGIPQGRRTSWGIADAATIARRRAVWTPPDGAQQATGRRAWVRIHCRPASVRADAPGCRCCWTAGNSNGTRVQTDPNLTIVDAKYPLAAVLGIPQAGEVNLQESLFDLGVDPCWHWTCVTGSNDQSATVSLATLMGDITGDGPVAKLEDADERSHTGTESGTFA